MSLDENDTDSLHSSLIDLSPSSSRSLNKSPPSSRSHGATSPSRRHQSGKGNDRSGKNGRYRAMPYRDYELPDEDELQRRHREYKHHKRDDEKEKEGDMSENENSADSDDVNDNGDGEEKKMAITRSEILTFICLVVATLISWLAFSIMAPYFPNEAHRRGMGDTEVGIIFSLQALTVFITSPLVGKFMPSIGGKLTLVFGLFMEATGNILFGYCAKLNSTTAFITFAYVTRILVGLGVAFSVTSTMAINASTFPNHIARTVGILEMTSGVGLLLGPLVGGALYQLGGSSFMLPFIVIGGLDMVSMFLSLILLPSQNCKNEESGSVTEVIRIPAIWPLMLAAFMGSACLGFLEPTFSVHAANFTNNAFYIGLLFMLVSGCYAGSSPIWGWLGDAYELTRVFVVVGLFLGSLSLLFVGPSTFLHLPSRLWIVCIGLILFGIADGAIIVSTLSDMFRTAVMNDLPEDLRTHGVVAGIFNSAYSLGTVFGPWLSGGIMYQYYGFQMTSHIMSLLLLATALIVSLTSVIEREWQKRRMQKGGKKMKDLYNIRTDNAIPETVPLFQQPNDKDPEPRGKVGR